MQEPTTPLQKLRALSSGNQKDELASLVKKLKLKSYPNSILRFFADSQASQDKIHHPYVYPWHEPTRNLGAISGSPLVTVIVVSYNSSCDLARLLPTLKQQSYTNWELIVIENGHEDNRGLVESMIGDFVYLSADNPGFAEANNLGLEYASGELLLLLNPDVELQREALKELVHGIRMDCTVAATCPKIYFASPFSKITLRQPEHKQFNADISSILDGASYKKFFVREGSILSSTIIQSSKDGRISLDIAIDATTLDVGMILWLTSDEHEAADVHLDFEGSGENTNHLSITARKQTYALAISRKIHSASRFLLNNCSSGIRPESQAPFDIGFGEEDYGQYSVRTFAEAFCGCCVLLRRDLFVNRKIFISQFFAYYEDSELSFWIRSNRMNILYIPSSILYHRHSEKTVEKSDTWNLLVGRSSMIYQQIAESRGTKAMANNWKALASQESGIMQTMLDKLEVYDTHLDGRTPSKLISASEKSCVGIYNSYWSSLGGGEKHALDLAALALELGHDVYLVCETEFSINELSEYFQVELKGARKIVTSMVTESFTQRFDIFINSTYQSSLVSYAAVSYYVVSFPHRGIDAKFLESYVFLHNSEYTKKWSSQYWGKHSSIVIYPVLGFRQRLKSSVTQRTKAKERILLTVGRFNFQGHCKNQHLIASSFKELSLQGLISDEWKLVVVGSVNPSDTGSFRHFAEVKRILTDCNASVIANASKDQLLDIYMRSPIYIHAAGLMADPWNSPQKFEHFGISVFEAILNGCLPVVHEIGGPADQVMALEQSFRYSTLEGLKTAILEAVDHANQLTSGNMIPHRSPGINPAEKMIKVSIERAKKLLC